MTKYDVNTIKDLIERLDGPSALAKWAGTEPSAISNWDARGVIPPGWHLRLLIRAKREGFTINPELLGLSSEDMDFLLASRPDRAPSELAAIA